MKILKFILGAIICILSIPLLLIGMIGFLMLYKSIELVGYNTNVDSDNYLSGPFIGFSKN